MEERAYSEAIPASTERDCKKFSDCYEDVLDDLHFNYCHEKRKKCEFSEWNDDCKKYSSTKEIAAKPSVLVGRWVACHLMPSVVRKDPSDFCGQWRDQF